VPFGIEAFTPFGLTRLGHGALTGGRGRARVEHRPMRVVRALPSAPVRGARGGPMWFLGRPSRGCPPLAVLHPHAQTHRRPRLVTDGAKGLHVETLDPVAEYLERA
jgi:hypothetical protein